MNQKMDAITSQKVMSNSLRHAVRTAGGARPPLMGQWSTAAPPIGITLAGERRLGRACPRCRPRREWSCGAPPPTPRVVPIEVGGVRAAIDYAPAESTTAMFGGNFNWRGPLWLATSGPASAHQTGWTGLVADLIRPQHERYRR